MENILRQKYKLPKPAARSIVAEAKSSLKMSADVTYSKALEHRCVKIAEDRGFLENGKPIEKKPARTTWIPSQPTMKSSDLRNRVTKILQDQPSERPHPTSATIIQVPVSPSPAKTRKAARRGSKRVEICSRSSISRESSGHRKGRDRNTPNPPQNERPRRSRFVPSAHLSKVLDPIVETSYSTDDSDVGSVSSHAPVSTPRARRRRPRNISNASADTQNTQTSCSSAGTSATFRKEFFLREHIMTIVGDCTEIDVISDHAKGFRATDFDSRSYTSLTVSTDGESVSSSGSSLHWGGSPRKTSEARNSVSMGPATVKSLAMRFGGAAVAAAPPRPVRRNSNDNDDHVPPPIRVLDEPPIRVVETPARLVTSFS